LAARVSAGAPMPDGGPSVAGGVVLLSAEDGLADTIRPRLDAAGADVGRVLALASTDGTDSGPLPAIPDDLPLLGAAIRQVGARLVVIDPLMAYLADSVNSFPDQDVRRSLAPL